MHYGSCLCGSIKYRVDDNLKFIVNCHCRYCRKAHGAPFTTLLIMPFNKFEIMEGIDLLATYEVRAINTKRCFCSQCGSRLYNYSPSRGMISLVVATLDTATKIQPIANINTASQCAWYEIPDDLPRFGSVPSRDEFGQLLSPGN
jgi:hypothetical protein